MSKDRPTGDDWAILNAWGWLPWMGPKPRDEEKCKEITREEFRRVSKLVTRKEQNAGWQRYLKLHD